MSEWTPERINLLKKLWRNGLSCSQIAKELGGVSRNAVIGKVHRLGLAGRARMTAAQPRQKMTPEQCALVKRLRQRQVLAQPPKPTSAVPAQPVEPSMAIPSRRLSILDLRNGMCKWPHGDPQDKTTFWFCGEPAVIERPYCLLHCQMAYQGLPARRKAA